MRSALSGVPDFWDPFLGLSGNRRQGSHHADNERAGPAHIHHVSDRIREVHTHADRGNSARSRRVRHQALSRPGLPA